MRKLMFFLLVLFVVPCMAEEAVPSNASFLTRLGDGVINWIGQSQPSFGKLSALVVAIGLVFVGLRLPNFISQNKSLQTRSFELMAMIFILPVVLIVSIIPDGQQATLAVLGTMIGYVFGVQGGKKSEQHGNEPVTKQTPQDNDG